MENVEGGGKEHFYLSISSPIVRILQRRALFPHLPLSPSFSSVPQRSGSSLHPPDSLYLSGFFPVSDKGKNLRREDRVA